MIEIENLTKKYGNTTVYENFNLTLESGKITCILGESGSGKTTLLNCIAALTPYQGKITPVKCSYIFQTPRLVPNLTVNGNLKLVCKDQTAVDEMLEKVRLSDKKNDYPNALSGGQAQRVAIARAFLFGGDVILMDEPFSSLDLKLKNQISKLFVSMCRESNKTALFVTHDVDEAAMLSDRALVLSGGKIIYDCTPREVAPRDIKSADKVRGSLVQALLL